MGTKNCLHSLNVVVEQRRAMKLPQANPPLLTEKKNIYLTTKYNIFFIQSLINNKEKLKKDLPGKT